MSWDLYVHAEVDGNAISLPVGSGREGHWGYTHNCNGMMRAAGLDWSMEGIDAMSKAGTFAQELGKAIDVMRKSPEKFRCMNPENGWGSFDGTTLAPEDRGVLAVLEEILDVAVKFPSATWSASF